MPLIKRAVSPVDVSRGRLPANINKDELQCVANGTLANLIRQLSSLSKHAEHIVGEIYLDAMKLDHKTNILQQRIERLIVKVTQLDSSNEQASLGEVQMRKAFKSSMLVDQHTLDRSTLPTALLEVYSKCDPPPNLDALNPYRDDPVNALSLYTNPSFFFNLWRKEMLKDCGNDRRRMKSPTDGSKSPKKRRRPPQQHQPDVPRQHSARYMSNLRNPVGALSFPEEYQAPQDLGLQLNRNKQHFQPMRSSSPVLPPPGMSVLVPPMTIERNDSRPSVSPPKDIFKRNFNADMGMLSIDDDDDDLPPPPPPLMHTSIVHQMPPPPQNNIQFLPSEIQNIPPPPPPPPPPSNLFAATNNATFSGPSKSVEPKPVDQRNNLLEEIKKGKQLKKILQAEEEKAQEEAIAQNDITAILKRRMAHTMGTEDDDSSQSSETSNGDEWD